MMALLAGIAIGYLLFRGPRRGYSARKGGAKPKKPDSLPTVSGTPKPPTGGAGESSASRET